MTLTITKEKMLEGIKKLVDTATTGDLQVAQTLIEAELTLSRETFKALQPRPSIGV
jgi:hypothetical protein